MTDQSQIHHPSNVLSLVRLKPQCKIIPTRVDFSTSNKLHQAQPSITPSFSNDRCYYTPSFTLPADHAKRQQDLANLKCQFEENISRNLREYAHSSAPESFNVIPPSSHYCQICQQRFEDYFAHILLKSHLIKMTRSQASLQINQLCQIFQAQLHQNKARNSKKKIKKQQKIQLRQGKQGRKKQAKFRSACAIQGINIQNHSTCIIEDMPHA